MCTFKRTTQQHSLDEQKYLQLQQRQQKEWEQTCQQCGACCGIIEGDPCEHLIEIEEKKFLCRIYNDRFGMHQTRSGRFFKCVPIRQILNKSWPGDFQCRYKKRGGGSWD